MVEYVAGAYHTYLFQFNSIYYRTGKGGMEQAQERPEKNGTDCCQDYKCLARTENTVAGLLTYPLTWRLPILILPVRTVAGVPVSTTGFTAAGTVQDSNLVPFSSRTFDKCAGTTRTQI